MFSSCVFKRNLGRGEPGLKEVSDLQNFQSLLRSQNPQGSELSPLPPSDMFEGWGRAPKLSESELSELSELSQLSELPEPTALAPRAPRVAPAVFYSTIYITIYITI